MLQADEHNWLLGYCPAGRYWIAALPVLIWAGGRGAAALSLWPRPTPPLRLLRCLAIALTLPGLALAALQAAAFFRFQEGYYLPLKRPGNAARSFLESTGIDIAFVFPRYPFEDARALLVWCAAGLVFVSLALAMERRRKNRTGDPHRSR